MVCFPTEFLTPTLHTYFNYSFKSKVYVNSDRESPGFREGGKGTINSYYLKGWHQVPHRKCGNHGHRHHRTSFLLHGEAAHI